MSFVYMFVFFPIYAQFGGGKGGAKIMFSKLFRPAAVSFGTCSSVATIPTNMEVADETGISKDVTDIVLPMGATMHMDGSAMSAIIKVAFLFGVFGLDFTTEKAILAIIVAVFSSVAMSGIPGGGGTGELVVCTIFFPDQLAVAYPIALAIGNLVDPPATMVNSAVHIAGDDEARLSSSNLPMYQIPSTRKHYGVPDGRNFLCLEKSRSAVSTRPT